MGIPGRAAGLALSALACVLGAGCTSSTISVRVDSTEETNGGRPFYVVVRSVDNGTFVTEGYEAVAAKVFSRPSDPSIVRSEVVFPGVSKEIEVERKEALPLSIYFMFTKPGERWRMCREQPLPSSIDVELGANEIKSEG